MNHGKEREIEKFRNNNEHFHFPKIYLKQWSTTFVFTTSNKKFSLRCKEIVWNEWKLMNQELIMLCMFVLILLLERLYVQTHEQGWCASSGIQIKNYVNFTSWRSSYEGFELGVFLSLCKLKKWSKREKGMNEDSF